VPGGCVELRGAGDFGVGGKAGWGKVRKCWAQASGCDDGFQSDPILFLDAFGECQSIKQSLLLLKYRLGSQVFELS
jgi:hypothetical protein